MTKEEQKLREFIIKVGSMGGSFLGEHGMVHEPTLSALVEELELLIEKLNEP